MAAPPASCPSVEVLEAVAAGQAAPAAVAAHLAACDACRAALERIRADNQFLAEFAVDGALPVPRGERVDTPLEIPGYEILREIHRGGQGVVFLAEQRATRRAVAIKVMRQGPFATRADRKRFDREIATLSRLNHPNIVAVHDAGTVAGFQYFVMNYVDGEPLDAALSRYGPPGTPARLAATLRTFLIVCDAVDAAHQQGVVHRDLKPSNIRVDRAGTPYVLDFGLARSVDPGGESAMTRTGQFVGSLPWAAPEQVAGEPSLIDARTDVYALGAVLYQLLTGVVPFDAGSSLRDVFDSILFREPTRPNAVLSAAGSPRLDDELETIVLKCLSKDRARRYADAGGLARDLRRYLAGEAVEAKRESALYVLRKSLRRYRLRVAVAGAFVVLTSAFALVMTVLYRHSTRLEQHVRRSAVSLTELLTHSNIEQGRMAAVLGNHEQAEQLLWGALLTHRAADGAAVQLHEPPGPIEAYWALWELYRRFPCLRTITLPPVAVRGLARTRAGDGVWTAAADGTVQRHDATGACLERFTLAFSGGQGVPLVAADGDLVVRQIGPRCELWRRASPDRPTAVLPDGDTIVGGHLAADGTRLAVLRDGVAVVWRTEPLTEVARCAVPDGALLAAALSHDGRLLAARDREGGLHVWDVATGRLVRHAADDGTRGTLRPSGRLVFSPDDRWLYDGWLAIPGRVWDLSADPPTAVMLAEQCGEDRHAAFSPDGRRLAVGDLGGVLRVFEVATGRRLAAFVAHPGRVRGLAFSPDGRTLWSCGDTQLRLFDSAADPGAWTVRVPGESFHTLDVSADGRWIVAGGALGQLHTIAIETRAVTSRVLGPGTIVSCVALSPDGRHTAAATYDNAVLLWEGQPPAGEPRALPHPQRVSYAMFSPDGTQLVTGCDDGVVRVWNPADGTVLREFSADGHRVPQVVFDPAGRRLAAAVRSGALLVWSPATGAREEWAPASHRALRAVRFTPDGRRLLTGGAERVLEIWDAENGARVARLTGHNQEIYCLDVSADGTLVATGDSGGVIRLWHVTRPCPLAALERHEGAVMAVHFGPDGRSLVSASNDGTVRIWDLTAQRRHIAGNVAAQLDRLGADALDGPRAAAWRRWAAATWAADCTATDTAASGGTAARPEGALR